MKHLGDFAPFDFHAFAKDKVFEVLGVQAWKDNQSQRFLGSKVEVVIKEDHTHYNLRAGESSVTNMYEKLIFKVSGDSLVDIPLGSIVQPVGVVATIYGDYRNNLSVKCDRIDIIQPVKKTDKVPEDLPFDDKKGKK